MLSTIGVFLGIQGYAYQYPIHWSPGITIFFFGMVNFFIAMFIYELFMLNTRLQKVCYYFLAAISLFFSCFSLLGYSVQAFEGLYSIVIGTQILIVGICGWHAIKTSKDRWLLFAISLSFFVSALGLINDKIHIPLTELIDDAFQPMSLVEIILFAFVLLKRFYYINIEKQEAIELARVKSLESLSLAAEKEKMRVNAEIGSTVAQIAHDIRSPLSAFSMVTSDLSALPEAKRIIMRSAFQRINDIANNFTAIRFNFMIN